MGNGDKLLIILRKLDKAEAFKLSEMASQTFFSIIKNLDLPQVRWKRLVLEVRQFCEECLLGFYQLARSLGQLEELIIYTESARGTEMLALNLSSPCLLPKLKTVTMHGYEKTLQVQLQLIEFLLKSAVVLDTFHITPGKHKLKADEEVHFLKRVSGFPRTSSTAKVVFA